MAPKKQVNWIQYNIDAIKKQQELVRLKKLGNNGSPDVFGKRVCDVQQVRSKLPPACGIRVVSRRNDVSNVARDDIENQNPNISGVVTNNVCSVDNSLHNHGSHAANVHVPTTPSIPSTPDNKARHPSSSSVQPVSVTPSSHSRLQRKAATPRFSRRPSSAPQRPTPRTPESSSTPINLPSPVYLPTVYEQGSTTLDVISDAISTSTLRMRNRLDAADELSVRRRPGNCKVNSVLHKKRWV